MFRRDFLTTCIATSSLGLVDIVKLIESGEPTRIAERAVSYFNDNKIGRTILENTIINEICHFHYYEQDKEPYDYSCRYDPVLKSGYMLGACGIGQNGNVEIHTEGEYTILPTFPISGAIDWLEEHDKKEKVVCRAFQILEWMYVKKVVDEMMHTFLACGVDRNMLVFDQDNSVFTSHLVDLMKRVGDDNKSPLTHLIVSPEAYEDIGKKDVVNDVKILVLDELGKKQEYQRFFEDQLSGTLPNNKEQAKFKNKNSFGKNYQCTELIIGVAYGKDGAALTQPEEKILKFKLSYGVFKDSDGQQRYGVHFGSDDDCRVGCFCEQNKVLLGCF